MGAVKQLSHLASFLRAIIARDRHQTALSAKKMPNIDV